MSFIGRSQIYRDSAFVWDDFVGLGVNGELFGSFNENHLRQGISTGGHVFVAITERLNSLIRYDFQRASIGSDYQLRMHRFGIETQFEFFRPYRGFGTLFRGMDYPVTHTFYVTAGIFGQKVQSRDHAVVWNNESGMSPQYKLGLLLRVDEAYNYCHFFIGPYYVAQKERGGGVSHCIGIDFIVGLERFEPW